MAVEDEVWFDGATSVINMPFLQPSRGGEGNKDSGLNIFHYEVSYNHKNWEPIAVPWISLVEGVAEGE